VALIVVLVALLTESEARASLTVTDGLEPKPVPVMVTGKVVPACQVAGKMFVITGVGSYT
jgi:hypothetical protein